MSSKSNPGEFKIEAVKQVVDQDSQYTNHEWQAFLKQHGLEGSMSRRGNCHDNAVAESFFQLLKRERIHRHIYTTREAARSDVFNYIEMFYNTRRRHGFNNQLSPVEYEAQYEKRLASVQGVGGDSRSTWAIVSAMPWTSMVMPVLASMMWCMWTLPTTANQRPSRNPAMTVI